MELPYTNFEDALGYFYDCGLEFTDVNLAPSIGLVLEGNDIGTQDCRRVDHSIPLHF